LNQQSLLRLGLAFALSLVAASTAPPGLVLAMLSGLLFLCGCAATTVAALLGDPFLPRHLTRWDEAVVLALASIVLEWFIDPAEVEAALQAAGAMAP
jgi:hypothetical protein